MSRKVAISGIGVMFVLNLSVAFGLSLVNAAQAYEMWKAEPERIRLIDVRTPEEFAAGHIAGAVNIPYDQVAAHLQEIPKDKEVVLYCKSGRRAGLAAESLAANGYTRLAHLEGDMQGWAAAGRPVVSSAPTPAEAK